MICQKCPLFLQKGRLYAKFRMVGLTWVASQSWGHSLIDLSSLLRSCYHCTTSKEIDFELSTSLQLVKLAFWIWLWLNSLGVQSYVQRVLSFQSLSMPLSQFNCRCLLLCLAESTVQGRCSSLSSFTMRLRQVLTGICSFFVPSACPKNRFCWCASLAALWFEWFLASTFSFV